MKDLDPLDLAPLTADVAKKTWFWARTGLTGPALLLAGKAALAVGIAWIIAPFIPGVANDYPYYAPLGVLVSMYPTLMGSLKNGLQTVAGLAIGALLAGAVIIFSEPNVLTLSIMVGIGFLISGSKWITTAREFVPITALFVLIIGGPDADSYSLGYVIQVCLGIIIGLGVNLLILPPLPLKAVEDELARFRKLLAKHLTEVGDALVDTWPPEQQGWASRSTTLGTTGGSVRSAVRTADESRKGNPRTLNNRRNLSEDYDDLAALEVVSFHLRDLTDVLTAAVWGKPIPLDLPSALRPRLSEAFHATAAVLTGWGSGEADQAAFHAADESVKALMTEVEDDRGANVSFGAAVTIAMDLRRILAALEPSISRDADTAPGEEAPAQ